MVDDGLEGRDSVGNDNVVVYGDSQRRHWVLMEGLRGLMRDCLVLLCGDDGWMRRTLNRWERVSPLYHDRLSWPCKN